MRSRFGPGIIPPGTRVVHVGAQASPPAIGTLSAQSISTSVPFSFTPTVSNPLGLALSWSASALPAGLTINSSSGTISGTPTTPGTTSVQLTVSYSGATSGTTLSNAVNFVVSSQFSFNSIANQTSLINEAFTFTPSVNAGSFTPTYSISAGTLPTGLSISSTTGTISGTPTVAGTQSGITIRANLGTGTVDSAAFNIKIQVAPTIGAITTPQNGVGGEAFSFTPSTTNPDSVALSWGFFAGGLPSGLSLNASTGAITGIPVGGSGTSGNVLRASFGNSSHADSNAFALVMKNAPTIAAISDQVQATGVAFTFTPTITNKDSLTLTYSIATGSLPTGITINSSTGVISGTPTDQTTTVYSAITVRVSYSSSHVDSNAFAFTISASQAKAALGVNLAEMVDYGSQFAFKNMIKQGRSWTPSSGTLTLDSTGYPTSLAAGQSARMYWITAIPSSGTSYALTSNSGQGTFTKTNQGATQMFWDLTSTVVGDEFRNAVMNIPGTSDPTGTQPFYQPFLDMLAGFGVIRFMDWDSINVNRIVNWSDRTTTDQYSYTGGTSVQLNVHGVQTTVPYEHMITLCNTLSCDMWVCVPAAASDDYITQLATLIFNNLNPALHCYFELSNEVWNGSFYGNQYFQSQAVALGLGNTFTNIMQAYSLRCVQMYALVDAVFAGQLSRRYRVMGAQSSNTGTISIPMSYQNAYQHVDYVAIAPYLLLNLPTSATQADIQTHIYASNDGYAKNVSDVNAAKAIITGTYGKAIAFYEFGPGFPNALNDPNANAYFTYNISNAMQQSMTDYLNAVWVGAGGSCPACWFNLCGPQAQFDWGLCRTVLDTNTAKMRAIQSFLHIAPQAPPALQAPIISTISDGYATQNVAYSFTPSVSNPSSLAQSFSLNAGTLPTGLSLNASTGAITGTPTVVQTKTGLVIADGYSGAASGTVLSNAFNLIVQSAGSGPVAGYTAWYDPSDAGNTTIVSSAFSQINDKSANGYHLTQSSAGSRPPTTTINSRTATSHPWNGLFMTGTTGTNMLATQAYTAFIVIKPTTPTSNATDFNNNAAWGFSGATATGLYLSSGTPSFIALNDDGALDQATATFTASTAYVVCTKHDGTNISISVNGGAFTDVASGATAALGNTFNWGRGVGASPWFQGSLGEAIFYNTVLSAGNISSNITYLRNKWSI